MKKTQIFWVRMPILSSECSLARLSQQVGKTVDDNSGHLGKANTQINKEIKNHEYANTSYKNTQIHKKKQQWSHGQSKYTN